MPGHQRQRDRSRVDGILEQWFEQGSPFGVCDTPANDSAAEDVNDDVKVEIGPFFRTHQLGYVPGPDLIGPSASNSDFW